MTSLQDKITAANPVRFIEVFISYIDVVKLSFQSKIIKSIGRPSFSTNVFFRDLPEESKMPTNTS